MIWILVVGMLGGGVSAAAAQQPTRIAGLVVDEAGVPIARAEVRLVETGRSVLTAADGAFALDLARGGAVRLEATRLGYAPVRVTVEAASEGAVGVTIRMRPTPLFLPEVLVTAMPSPGSTAELARSATQLSGRALERRLTGSVAGTLAEEPGIAVRWNGPGAATPVVRGLSGERVVVLQDGQRTADLSGTADDHMLTIDPLTARRIEVVRGPAALLYGSNALGGVVNVLTEEAGAHRLTRREHAAAFQTESAYPGAAASVRTAQPLGGGWTAALRLSGRTTDDVRIPDAAGSLHNTHTRNAGGALTLGRGGDHISGTVTLRALGFRYGLPMPPGEEDDLELSGRAVALSARLDAALASSLFPALRASFSANDYAHDELEAGAVEMAFGLRTALLNVQLRQASLGRLSEGAWGASLSWRDYVATGEDQLTAPARAAAAGLFVYQEAPLGGVFAAQLGARLDHHVIASRDDARFGPGTTSSFTAASGSAGVSAARGPLSAALSVARSFRAPTVEELFSRRAARGHRGVRGRRADARAGDDDGMDAVVRCAARG
jgi:iron complex outermembrane recepter protein